MNFYGSIENNHKKRKPLIWFSSKQADVLTVRLIYSISYCLLTCQGITFGTYIICDFLKKSTIYAKKVCIIYNTFLNLLFF